MHSILREKPARLLERRLAERVRKSWIACADGRLPSWSDIQAADLGSDCDACFTVDLALTHDVPYFIYLGEKLSRLSDLYLSDAAAWKSSPLELMTAKMDEAALSRAPVYVSDMVKTPKGRRIAFRSVLLPLSDNGEDVSHVFGAANGKGV